MNETPDSLLATDEPPPFTVDNENGTSPLLIVADHAGKHFPRRLGQLGLSNAECERHIAWDIGVGAVCCLIGKALNAVVVQQNYSRLVIDCNRTPGSGTSILDLSELTRVPGNIGLSERHKLARVREIFQPYHDRIVTELDRRREAARPTALISVHSFTPVFKTVARLWHVGVLYNRDQRFAQILMELLHREEGLVVGDNEPYSVTDASDYTIPFHGEQRDLHPCGTRNSPRPHHGRSGSADVGGVVCAIASASLSAAHRLACRSPVKPRALSERWTPITSTIVASQAFVRLERG
jgi:predicted N-formylglutamate amidohydrolase